MGWLTTTLLVAATFIGSAIKEGNALSQHDLAAPFPNEAPFVSISVNGQIFETVADSANGIPDFSASVLSDPWDESTSHSLVSRQVAVPSSGCAQCSGPLISINVNDCILGCLAGTVDGAATLTSTLLNTLNLLAAGTLSLVNGIAGAAGGVLNATLTSVAEVLSTSTRNLLNTVPLAVLDSLVKPLLYPHPLDPLFHGWQYWGCFNSTAYLIGRQATILNAASLNPKICVARCALQGAEYAVLVGGSCYCSDIGPPNNGGSNKCSTPCPGNPGFFCGGIGANAAMSVFRRAVALIQGPLPLIPELSGWRYQGCYYGEAFITAATSTGKVTTFAVGTVVSAKTCSSNCTAYTYSALYKNTCYCSNIAPGAALLGGLGQCTSQPCQGNAGECCGGESNGVPTLGKTFSIMITVYVKAPALLTGVAPPVNTTGPQGWTNWGCYYGALYLLDTIFGGFQVSGLLDAVPSMNADKCITLCLKANLNFNFAMTLRGACFCTLRPPTEDLLHPDQSKCNEPCPGNPGERCGGSLDPIFSPSLGYRLINVVGRAVKPPLPLPLPSTTMRTISSTSSRPSSSFSSRVSSSSSTRVSSSSSSRSSSSSSSRPASSSSSRVSSSSSSRFSSSSSSRASSSSSSSRPASSSSSSSSSSRSSSRSSSASSSPSSRPPSMTSQSSSSIRPLLSQSLPPILTQGPPSRTTSITISSTSSRVSSSSSSRISSSSTPSSSSSSRPASSSSSSSRPPSSSSSSRSASSSSSVQVRVFLLTVSYAKCALCL